MPGNLASAFPTNVMPANLSTAFSEDRSFPVLAIAYHDGAAEVGLITDTVNPAASIRSWKLAQKLSPAAALAMLAFFEGQGAGLTPFYWYNPFEASPGFAAGSNYDPTGASPIGRHLVVFRGNWSQTMGLPRTDIPLSIAEID